MTDGNVNGCSRISPWLVISGAANLFLLGVLFAPLLHGPHPLPPGIMPQPGMIQQQLGHMPPPFAADGFERRHGPEDGGPGESVEPKFLIDRLAERMSAEDAKAFRAIYAQQESRLKTGHDQMHEAITKVAIILRSEKPDSTALKAVLDGVEAGHGQMHETMSGMIQRVASDLSLEGRRKVADFLEHMPK